VWRARGNASGCFVFWRVGVWVRRVSSGRREQGKLAPPSGSIVDAQPASRGAAWILAKLDQRPVIYLRELVVAAREERGWEASM
jgi:hypothetical protein